MATKDTITLTAEQIRAASNKSKPKKKRKCDDKSHIKKGKGDKINRVIKEDNAFVPRARLDIDFSYIEEMGVEKAPARKDKKKVGRPEKYPDTKPGLRKFNKICSDYLSECASNGIYPTKGMLCLALGITMETLSEYKKRDKFTGTIMHVEQSLSALKVHNLVNNKAINEKGATFDLRINDKLLDPTDQAKLMDAETNKGRLELEHVKHGYNVNAGVTEVVEIKRVIDVNIDDEEEES